jgi:DNA-binding response OmpR family regulator
MALEKKVGWEVIQAGDGQEAYEKAAKVLPDAILLDVGLPKMDGLTVCEKLSVLPSTAQIPIAFITANSDPQVYKRAAKAGSLMFVPKPFKPERLVSLVNVLLSSSKESKEV